MTDAGVKGSPIDQHGSKNRMTAMNERPTDLDGRRSLEQKIQADLRRKAANRPGQSRGEDGEHRLDTALSAEPAQNWIEATVTARFLLERYAATPDASDARIQTLIARALCDMTRLRKREEKSE
jgi:hypothetical protein